MRQKIKPSNGAKSTARIYHDEIMAPSVQPKAIVKSKILLKLPHKSRTKKLSKTLHI